MGDFFSGVSSNLKGNVLPNKDEVFDRKTDKQRENFLRGVSTTKHGKKEDPTYLHFRFIFDFGDLSSIDPETFLAPSPLFKAGSPIQNYEAQFQSSQNEGFNSAQNNNGSNVGTGNSDDPNNTNNTDKNTGSFEGDTDFFYGTKFRNYGNPYAANEVMAFSMHDVAYVGASEFLKQRSTQRSKMIDAFKSGLRFINKNSPHYFQQLSGLDTIVKGGIKNYFKGTGSIKRAGTITVDCIESIDMRISAIAELYRKAVFDYTNHRTMLPENLRKFRMYIVITEIRNINLTGNNINDILNPFNIPIVSQGANFLDSFNSQTGLIDEIRGGNKSTNSNPNPSVSSQLEDSEYSLQPYVWMYQLDQCEFDFDDTYPSFNTIDNKGGSAVSTSFKINVGRVKDYKIQFNELADYIDKNDNVKNMVISDIFGNSKSDYTEFDYTKSFISANPLENNPNAGEYFGQLASNFINNSVADLVGRGISIAQGALLGNIYGFGGLNPSQVNSVQSLVNTVKSGIPNPFADNTPQGQGLGGPEQRVYPTPNDDVYKDVPPAQGENLGNILPDGSGPINSLNTDVYGNVPGTDLGLPDRQYPSLSTDEYKEVPGENLGVPTYPYNTPPLNDDIYGNVPGTDLGLPDRQYPNINDDQYNNVPGVDSGVPDRIYQEPNDDIYPTSEGPDLGLPDRQYPDSSGDEYTTVPGADSGVPGRIYNEPNGDTYPTSEGPDLGLPDRQYPDSSGDEYEDVNGKDLGVPSRVYTEPNGDFYPTSEGPDLGLPDRQYPDSSADLYDDVNGKDLGVPDRTYKQPQEDVYPTSEGTDLGVPDRQYPGVEGDFDAYRNNPGRDLGVPGRSYDTLVDKVYNEQDTQYPGAGGTNEYPDPVKIDNNILDDVYPKTPGEDLGPPDRIYPENVNREYIEKEEGSQPSLGRIYPKTDDFGNLI